MKAGWIGVDLDGTLAVYNGWEGPTSIGAPIEPMVERVRNWLAMGYEVRILTARVYDDEDGSVTEAVQQWAEKNIGQVLEVTCVKDYDMLELWDDRAVTVEANTGRPLVESRRGL